MADYQVPLREGLESYTIRDGNQALADAVRWNLAEERVLAYSTGRDLSVADERNIARRHDIRLRRLCGAPPYRETERARLVAMDLDEARRIFEEAYNTHRFWQDRQNSLWRDRQPPPPRVDDQERRRRRDAAEQKAYETFWAHLDEEQRRQWREYSHFDVQSQYGATYRIEKRTQGNVRRLSDRRGFCVVFHDSGIPNHDLWLAQKLLLEGDERKFLQVAEGHEIL